MNRLESRLNKLEGTKGNKVAYVLIPNGADEAEVNNLMSTVKKDQSAFIIDCRL